MRIETTRETIPAVRVPPPPLLPFEVTTSDLTRIDERAHLIRAKAMELTDTWGGAMFIMDPARCELLFRTLGFSQEVAAVVYERAYNLGYVQHTHADGLPTSAFTWHGPDITVLVLRGFGDPGKAFTAVTDQTARSYFLRNLHLFQEIMKALPEYASNLMFSTRIACNVLRAFGASLSEDTIFDLALEFGGQRTTDLEGRRGVATQFVRAFTLTLSATIE